jgi:hypothetical protein
MDARVVLFSIASLHDSARNEVPSNEARLLLSGHCALQSNYLRLSESHLLAATGRTSYRRVRNPYNHLGNATGSART